jgi:cytochrome c-type biogenesis protein CcmH
MTTFVLLVAAIIVAVVILVALPLVRAGTTADPPARWAALAAAAVLVFGASLLYVTWSNWKWHAATEVDSPQTMVARLARQLEQDPKNLDGWLTLGRSYLVLQEYPLALRAFERADRMSEGKNEEALMGEAEALALSDESELAGRAGKLIERALLLAPDSGKALFFGGAAAARRGELPLARERFAKLLSMNPPANIRPMIEQQISALDEQLAAVTRAATPGSAVTAGPADPGAAVRVNVSLGARLAAGAPGPLFVFVRKPGEGGPPLAAKRLEGRFPQSVILTPADAMIPGRTFGAGQQVEVVARIARSGNPVGAKGDPFGRITYRVGQDGVVNIVIDQVTP